MHHTKHHSTPSLTLALTLAFIAGCQGEQLDDVPQGFIYLTPPPDISESDSDLVITDDATQGLIHATLASAEPVRFDSGHYEATDWPGTDCMIRDGELRWGEQSDNSGDSFVEAGVEVDVGDAGWFWIDASSCSVYAFRAEIPDHLRVAASRDMHHQRKELAFLGEILDLAEDLPEDEAWDSSARYELRVDEAYWNLLEAPIEEEISARVIGWIQPKTGPVWVFAEEEGDGQYQAYIAAEPRAAWFEPEAGRYQLLVLNIIITNEECYGQECWTNATVEGEILETEQGLDRTGMAVSFQVIDPEYEVGDDLTVVATFDDSGHSAWVSVQ